MKKEIAMSHLKRFVMMDENGDDHEIDLPTRMEVCPDCDGHGTHVNESIDAHGIGSEEFAEDPDFKEAYYRGDYDVTCTVCKGLRVVPVVDRANADPDDLKLYDECEKVASESGRFDREYHLERDAERRMGA
jgi:hypothetical protein